MRKYLSFFLIALLGYAVVVDAIIFESKSRSCANEFKLNSLITPSTQISCEGHSEIAKTSSSDGDESSCADPCHSGICHFGHGSYIPLSSAIAFHVLELNDGVFGLSLHKIKAPFLEGPRRPPRLA